MNDEDFEAASQMWLVPEFVPMPAWFWLPVGVSAPVIGVFCVYRMRVALALPAAFALLGGYIQAVHIYNALNPGQHMGFIGPSWIS